MPTHTRIRMFNTKDTYPNQVLDNDLCQAVRAGNTVYVRGQVGTDFDGNLVGLGDPAAQTEQAMQNAAQLLKEAGSDISHVVNFVGGGPLGRPEAEAGLLRRRRRLCSASSSSTRMVDGN